ncbi:unnamed protein product [Tilletia caries]|uniref:Uncharacterized protein n=1 Tax=Tilletia caries TaxID=13290 RepID=A0ABN7JE28_9BASI|nr:unnamed protein product [Tilletia caries]
MVPCVAYLSTDTTSRSFQHLLRALENEVVAEAARVCSDDDRTPQAKLDTADVLLANARRICEERSWRPSTVMVDKCRAELNAINEGQFVFTDRSFLAGYTGQVVPIPHHAGYAGGTRRKSQQPPSPLLFLGASSQLYASHSAKLNTVAI